MQVLTLSRSWLLRNFLRLSNKFSVFLMSKNRVLKKTLDREGVKEGILERKNIDEIRYYEKMNDS